jgi:hypothetical protein
VKITECEGIEFYSKDELQYFTVENVIKRSKCRSTNVMKVKKFNEKMLDSQSIEIQR